MLMLLGDTFSSHPIEVEVVNEYVNYILVLFFIGNMCYAYSRYGKTVWGLLQGPVLRVGLLPLAGPVGRCIGCLGTLVYACLSPPQAIILFRNVWPFFFVLYRGALG